MPKITISYEFASLEEARAHLGTGAAAGAVTTGPAPGNAPPPRPGAPTTPPPSAASPPTAPTSPAPPPPSSAQPPAPPPAPAAAPTSTLHTEVLQAMQAYGKSPHKAAGIKRVLARVGLTAVKADTPPETMEWLKAVLSQQADGQFMTPEAIEAL